MSRWATRSQVVKIRAALVTIGMTDRDQARDFIDDAVGHQVEILGELTYTEAARLIQVIGQWGAAEPPTEPPTDGTDPWTETTP